MKRPHRRAHFLFWLIAAPVAIIGAFFAWSLRPQTPYTELPSAITDLSDVTEQH